MIDFHTHILPGMDDGSRSVESSLGLLRMEAQQGVTIAALTPHYYAQENSPQEFLLRRQRAWEQLQPWLEPGFPRCVLGAEVQYFEGICASEAVSCLRLEGTPYLLLEMPFFRWSSRMVEDVLDLQDREDIQVVLAHVERYLSLQDSQVFQTLSRWGVQFQGNCSFFGRWSTRRKAMGMLKNGQLHFLGSDCHNRQTRPPRWDLVPDRAKAMAADTGAWRALEACLQPITA